MIRPPPRLSAGNSALFWVPIMCAVGSAKSLRNSLCPPPSMTNMLLLSMCKLSGAPTIPKRKSLRGPVYSASCVRKQDDSGIIFSNQPYIRDVELSDLGGGVVKLIAEGDFYSSNLSVRAGATNYSPTFFDGSQIEVDR